MAGDPILCPSGDCLDGHGELVGGGLHVQAHGLPQVSGVIPQSYRHHDHPDLRQDIRLLCIRFYSYRHLLGQVMKEYRRAFTPLSKQKHQLSILEHILQRIKPEIQI